MYWSYKYDCVTWGQITSVYSICLGNGGGNYEVSCVTKKTEM